MSNAETVLVLESHPALLMYCVGVVEDAGFAALSASEVASATTLLESHQEIETVFADLDSPGCDAFLVEMRRRWPFVHLILTATDVSRSSSRIPRGAAFFPKPFSPFDIEATLSRFAA